MPTWSVSSVEHPTGLPDRQPTELWDDDFDDEATVRLEVDRGVAEDGDLFGLRGDVHDRVEHEVDDGERFVHAGGRHVADRHVDGGRTWLRPQPFDHVRRQLDPVHAQPLARQWQRDPSGTDGELERRSSAGGFLQEVDGGPDDRTVEHRGRGVVVDVSNCLVPT